MRTETITYEIYKFHELLEQVKEKAIEKFRKGHEYHWDKDNQETLKAFESTYPVSVKDWGYGGHHNHISFNMDNLDYDEILEFTDIRLMKWIINNFHDDLFHGKFICANAYPKKRYSKVMMEHAMPTGYCMDEDIRGPIYKFLKQPWIHATLEDLMRDCLQAWVESCGVDHDHCFSDEAIKEIIEADDYEFYSDGTLY